MSKMDPNPVVVPIAGGGEFVQFHDACTVEVHPADERFVSTIELADKCYGLNSVAFDREEAAALWPLMKQFAETGTIAAALPGARR